MPFNNLLQTCKPDSVSVLRLTTEDGYHLSGCYITATILLPTLQPSAASRHRASSPRNADLRGITAHKVYPSL